jgi:hypothetical protein
VTDEPGPDRSTRKTATYPKIAANHSAVLLKLADRIANVEASYRNGWNRYLNRYRKEHLGFMLALYDKNHTAAQPMWDRLSDLLLRTGKA